jgi:hypothetical protein
LGRQILVEVRRPAGGLKPFADRCRTSECPLVVSGRDRDELVVVLEDALVDPVRVEEVGRRPRKPLVGIQVTLDEISAKRLPARRLREHLQVVAADADEAGVRRQRPGRVRALGQRDRVFRLRLGVFSDAAPQPASVRARSTTAPIFDPGGIRRP